MAHRPERQWGGKKPVQFLELMGGPAMLDRLGDLPHARKLLEHYGRGKRWATSQIDQNDYQLGLQLTPRRTSDAAFEVQGRQRRRREQRRLMHLQRTTDRGWTEPPGTAALGSLDLGMTSLFQEA
ncbi:hypothetical protein THAOC_12396 [Thalassiosira oceanica]|uniref:Uncharacterized protein n=1 Tax=Thalassiosira oceanica TaxID=159749 RepID=K0SNX8_THAOC|nr:hypothetical protein THAOC_12396 [Thalassiosira oceanica]|eukprot:EJK66664.1 hypothetical protein THAOC_12396 [Thalassiosira oceanica]